MKIRHRGILRTIMLEHLLSDERKYVGLIRMLTALKLRIKISGERGFDIVKL